MSDATTAARPPTEAELAAIRDRESRATPGPWVYMSHMGAYEGSVVSVHGDASATVICETPAMDDRPDDMNFIAGARDDIPALLAALAARDAKVAERDNVIHDMMLDDGYRRGLADGERKQRDADRVWVRRVLERPDAAARLREVANLIDTMPEWINREPEPLPPDRLRAKVGRLLDALRGIVRFIDSNPVSVRDAVRGIAREALGDSE